MTSELLLLNIAELCFHVFIADAEGMARKLRETQDLLQAVETEKQCRIPGNTHNNIMLMMKDRNLETCSKFYLMFSFCFFNVCRFLHVKDPGGPSC